MKKIIFILFSFLWTSLFAQSPLCSSSPTNFGYEYVSSITINGKQFAGNTGYSGPGYYDYAYQKDTIPRITAGQSISISYTAQTKSSYREYFKLWIDFNGNGNLSDAGELVHAVDYTWSGTKTVTATFTVPTTVFNGQVYMRFIMVYSSSPTLCGNYSYGNTFDFVTTITGAKDPFKHSGYIYDSEGNGVSGLPVYLYNKTKSSSTYNLYNTYTTDANGKYTITTTFDTASYDFQLQINSLTITTPSTLDAIGFNDKIFTSNFNSKDYYRMDVNNDNRLNISDVFLIFMRNNGRAWGIGTPSYRLFTQSQWNVISVSTSNLKSTYSGVQSMTINNLKTNGNTNVYLVRSGYLN